MVKAASRFKSDITISRDDLEVNGKSIMGVMMLAAAKGSTAQAFLLASHGVVVLGRDIDDAVNNAEELEETAKLQFILRGEKLHYLTEAEIAELGGGY